MSQENNIWPTPTFRFSINIDGEDSSFQEVSGLNSETQAVEYRHGNTKVVDPVKMPGIQKTGNVTLKKGIFQKDNQLFQWYSQIKMNTGTRKTLVIKLLDESGNPTMTWTLQNAFPTKLTTTDLQSEGNEVAVESLEVAFETMVISAS
jgi:phage tail-like protein